MFCESLDHFIKLNSPIKSQKITTFPKWFSAELKQLVIQKKIMLISKHGAFSRNDLAYVVQEEIKQEGS